MKKISVICCFILITLFSTGSYLIYKCYLHSYKTEFKSYIFQNQGQTAPTIIQINPSELYTNSCHITWEDGNKEVIYDGILYDIIRIENNGLKVTLIAVSDEQEMSLKKQFSEIFNLHDHKSTKNPYHLLKNFFTLKCIIAQTSSDFVIHYLFCSAPQSTHSFLISIVYISMETPPPDFSV